MAKHCSVTQPAISRFESGKYDDLYLVLVYADLLSIDLLKEIRNI